MLIDLPIGIQRSIAGNRAVCVVCERAGRCNILCSFSVCLGIITLKGISRAGRNRYGRRAAAQRTVRVGLIISSGIVSIVDIDDNTGYGYLGLKMKKYALVSFYDDTEMNFPNNTYFVLISYLLALAFKAKQGSDTTQLAGLTEQAENAFYDTLAVDDWNSVRVTNVY
jgi:hypothetical protein